MKDEYRDAMGPREIAHESHLDDMRQFKPTFPRVDRPTVDAFGAVLRPGDRVVGADRAIQIALKGLPCKRIMTR